MKKKILFFSITFILSINAQAQKEATWWYFGENLGMDFTKVLAGQETVPQLITNGPINTEEGCFSVSDNMGNLLIASDGMKVYNSKKQRMKTPGNKELLGHPSSSQSGIIIPRPKHPNQFYIITVPHWGETSAGIYCYLTDLTANGGDGEVYEGKQLNLNGTGLSREKVYENIASIGHADGTNYWLTHRTRNFVLSWLVTENGIDAAPTAITNIGYDPGAPITGNDVSPGSIKFSLDNKYFLHFGWHGMTAGQFDNATGKVSNVTYRKDMKPYSGEFSPNGKYMYFGTSAGKRLQRLETGKNIATQTPITISNTVVYSDGIQLGPDNKLYAVQQANRPYLIIINNPNEGGTDVTLLSTYFPLKTRIRWNLPTFVASFFRVDGIYSVNYPCIGDDYNYEMYIFQIKDKHNLSHLIWDFGDDTPLVKQDYELYNSSYIQSHKYATPGNFTLTVKVYGKDGNVIDDATLSKEIIPRQCQMIINPANRSFYKH